MRMPKIYIKKESFIETFAVLYSWGILLLLLISFAPIQEPLDRILLSNFLFLGTERILILYIIIWMTLTTAITMAIFRRRSFLIFILCGIIETFIFIIASLPIIWVPFIPILSPLVMIPALYLSSVGLSFSIRRMFRLSIASLKIWRYGGYIFVIPIFWFAHYSTKTGLADTGLFFCAGCLLLAATLGAAIIQLEVLPRKV
ncbi:MAG: hypothetical protein M1536_06695 [Firmicutes bacterium]|nr:hypothetical protein [Bacillota bacterium]